MFKIVYWVVMIALYPFYRFRFVGRENIPEGAAVVCGNHTANSDAIFLVLANGPRGDYGFIAKEELFHVPFLRHLIRWLHAFPVKRGSGDMQAIRTGFSILKSGKKLLLFPQGTRVRDGKTVEPKTGAVIFATRAKVPLVPVYIPEGRKIFKQNTVIIGKPYFPELPEEKPTAEDYHAMTHELMGRIFALKEGEGA